MPMGTMIKLIGQDYKANKTVTIVLLVFLFLSSLLLACGLRVGGTMASSSNGLNDLAQPPDYLQMHKGDFDPAPLNEFVDGQEEIQEVQVVKARNISNVNIRYRGDTLESFLMDNGFVTQNQEFDFLLDMENKVASVREGEIGVPVYYAEELGIQVGETITIEDGGYQKSLTVSTLIRDAAMNAALTSSKRFLVSGPDLDELSRHTGEWEYSIEFLLGEGTDTAVLEKKYLDAGLPNNGVMVTGPLLSLLNNMSFGLIALILMAISILMIVIGLLCLSYIIRASMAEESAVIGEMKAIGFPEKSLKRMYQLKYLVLMAVSGIAGYLVSIPLGSFFSGPILRYCGQGNHIWLNWILPLFGILLLSLVVGLSTGRMIRKIQKRSVLELMKGDSRMRKEGHYKLPTTGMKRKNLAIAFGELKCKWNSSIVIFIVFVASSFLILLPLNMLSTVEDPSFITYMGVGESDIRMDLQFGEDLSGQKKAAVEHLSQDIHVSEYALYQVGYAQYKNAQGLLENIRVSSGDETAIPLAYQEGRAPSKSNEMALSELNATELGKKVGDTLLLTYGGIEREYTVSGIYQDVTYGGKTAKASIDFSDDDVEVYVFYVNLKDNTDITTEVRELRNALPGVKVTPVQSFVSQTMGGVASGLTLLRNVAIVMSLMLVILITSMVLRLMIAQEHHEIALKKALGFSNMDIRMQLGYRILAVQLLAIVTGTVLANDLGEDILGLMLSSLGASNVNILIESLYAFLISPASQMTLAIATIFITTKAVKNYHIRNQIQE